MKITMGYSYISQLIRISRICDTFQSFVIRHRLITERLIKHSKLCKFFKKFIGIYYELFSKYGVRKIVKFIFLSR